MPNKRTRNGRQSRSLALAAALLAAVACGDTSAGDQDSGVGARFDGGDPVGRDADVAVDGALAPDASVQPDASCDTCVDGGQAPDPEKPSGRFANNPFFGVHYDLLWQTSSPEDLQVMADRIRELNVGTVRQPLRWLALYDRPDVACEDMTIKPAVVAKYEAVFAALPSDVEVLAYLDSPPQACRDLFARDPEAFGRTYRRVVGEIVSLFKDRVRSWEVWNEQNNNHFYLAAPGANHWTPGQFVDYVLVPGAEAVRAADPEATVISGGVVWNGIIGINGDPPGPADDGAPLSVIPNWLESTYRALGDRRALFDGVGTHPYHWGDRPLPVAQTYGPNGTSTVMEANEDRATPIYWTEFGSAESGQARDLGQIVDRAVVHQDRADNPLAGIFVYSLRDRMVSGSLDTFGLMELSGARKEAFIVYRERIFQNGWVTDFYESFEGQRFSSDAVNPAVWATRCGGGGSTDCTGGGVSGGDTVLRLGPPARNWSEILVATRGGVRASELTTVTAAATVDVVGWDDPSNADNEFYSDLLLERHTDRAADPSSATSSVRFRLRKTSNEAVSFAILEGDDPVVPWQGVPCADADYSAGARVRFTVADGQFRVQLLDSTRRVCLDETFTGVDAASRFVNAPGDGVSLGLGALQKHGARPGTYTFDDVRMRTQ